MWGEKGEGQGVKGGSKWAINWWRVCVARQLREVGVQLVGNCSADRLPQVVDGGEEAIDQPLVACGGPAHLN